MSVTPQLDFLERLGSLLSSAMEALEEGNDVSALVMVAMAGALVEERSGSLRASAARK